MTSFELQAPAKINLCLKVTGRREDGYHELQSLMVPLSVGDALKVCPKESGLQIRCNQPDIPTNEDSLLGRAFRFAAEHLDYPGGLEIELSKETPIGAGLGGGSSDAAAVMRVVEQLTGRELPTTAYPELAYKVGADVPFFLHASRRPSAAWMEGIGEVLKPCSVLPELHVILINPGIHISTQKVYQELSQQLTSFEGPATVPPSFETLEQLIPYVTNDLESVVVGSHPIIAELKSQLTQHGAEAALMSGSGSTVFGLFSQNKTRDQALEILRNAYPDYWVCAAALLGR